MGCWLIGAPSSDFLHLVLILVLLEDGLLDQVSQLLGLSPPVLILVLLEDGLLECFTGPKRPGTIVLILVLLEDGLLVTIKLQSTRLLGLNPCFAGRWVAGVIP